MKVQADPDYLLLHLAPPVGRLNDPNGLLYQDGVYHAFYQHSPLHPEKAVFWRHATSTDVSHWEDRGSAIAPMNWYDKDGCYSGSAFLTDDGEHEFFYTGNVKDTEGNREAYQCFFTSGKGGVFEKSPENPLISGPERGYTAHYRDPQVIEREGSLWMVLGAQREDGTGAVVVYRSADRRAWDFAGEIEFSDPALRSLGYMFECPLLLSLPDQESGLVKDVLIFCPQGVGSGGGQAGSADRCGYVVGTLAGLYFEVETPFSELDAGFEFYAPQVFVNAPTLPGSALLMGWMGMPGEDAQPSVRQGWVHTLTYPRELTLRGGKLFQRFARQLDEVVPLRSFNPENDADWEGLAHCSRFRLRGTVDVSEPATLLLMSVGKNLRLTFSRDSVVVDRGRTRYKKPGAVRTCALPEATVRTFDLLVDASTMELLIDDGAASFTGRVFFATEERELLLTGPRFEGMPFSDVQVGTFGESAGWGEETNV